MPGESIRKTSVKSIIYVSLQFSLSSVLFLRADWLNMSLYHAIPFTVAVVLAIFSYITLRRSLSVMPEVRRSAELVTSGPYRLIRHPMYCGLLIASAALALLPTSSTSVLAWISLVIVLACKANYEEQFLLEEFSSYREYQTRTKRFIPGVY